MNSLSGLKRVYWLKHTLHGFHSTYPNPLNPSALAGRKANTWRQEQVGISLVRFPQFPPQPSKAEIKDPCCLLASHPQIAFCVYFSVIFHLNGFSLTAWWKAFGKFSPSPKAPTKKSSACAASGNRQKMPSWNENYWFPHSGKWVTKKGQGKIYGRLQIEFERFFQHAP